MRFILSLFLISLAGAAPAQSLPVHIIPQPVSVIQKSGAFTISRSTVIATRNETDRKAARFLNDYLQAAYGFQLDVDRQESRNYIRLNTRTFIQAPDKDAYTLNVTKEGVTIEGDTHAGTFYGIQTLIQLLPVEKSTSLLIPQVSVQDAPRFRYRGMHLDVGRHFFPVSFVKKYIDYLALHKMNNFHWHLTEDQGWRIEIKKYPRLTEIGAWRDGTIIGRFPGTGNDSIRYGGFYTQDEIREVVQYATDRHINVIPEIEMPGHSSAALEAYPHLGCPGMGPFKVEQTWGVFDDVYCAGNDSTFTFLQDVLDEVLTLFPSKYIHVGGDESPKNNWKKCPRCQARIKNEGLKDEHHLQSYFIQRMEKYLNEKGRVLIGWDEILEGGLAPNAVVMSWRGEEGGIEAARENHEVIMTPGNYVYFDHAQSQDEDSVTIGGLTPVEEVYSYEPVPKELPADKARFILGAQANVWTEYMKNTRKVEYMIFPRISALSEVLWSLKEKRSWADFEKRLPAQFRRYALWGVNYNNAYFDIRTTVAPAPGNKGVLLKLETKDRKGRLLYGIQGKHFAKAYTGPVLLTDSKLVTALYYSGSRLVDSLSIPIHFSKATGKKVTLKTKPAENYPGDGAFTLVNGIHNTKGLARSSEVLGYAGGADLETVIDLNTAQPVRQVVVHALGAGGTYVYPPKGIVVYGSTDGKTFRELAIGTEYRKKGDFNGTITASFDPQMVRYVKVLVQNTGVVPEGRRGAGNKTLLLVDEIEVR
ncbi:MAG TPA: family 20 glycosylhydrolase [Chitinophagaceae bacterium]|jgi:hexosaminidase|nr:family 20 glycosylhydrolase [Chitinophagaceae bacterium]